MAKSLPKFFLIWNCWVLIALAIEPEESLEFPALLLHLEKDYFFSFAFPFPSALFYVSFPIPFDAFRIGSLL